MCVNKPFGGISVLVVGDFYQLPPVMDSPIFKIPKGNEIHEFLDYNPLWDLFQIFELTEIMRQRDQKQFVHALNSLVTGKMTEDDINLISSRQVSESDVPQDAIRFFAENKNVELYNDKKINSHPGQQYISEAKDIILGKVNESVKQRVLETLKNKRITEVNGLLYILKLKRDIKYMITKNIDIEDGLVNGACGVLKFISFESTSGKPIKLWIDFHSERVGRKARQRVSEYMEHTNIASNLTPISMISITLNISNKLQHQTIRKQFPVVPAEALTIHKNQGQTYNSICVDLKASRRVTRQMLYVALSRVTNLSGLYILGEFKPPKLVENNQILEELNKMRREKKLNLTNNNLKTNSCTSSIPKTSSIQTITATITDERIISPSILASEEKILRVNSLIAQIRNLDENLTPKYYLEHLNNIFNKFEHILNILNKDVTSSFIPTFTSHQIDDQRNSKIYV